MVTKLFTNNYKRTLKFVISKLHTDQKLSPGPGHAPAHNNIIELLILLV